MSFPPRAGRVSGRATPSLRHAQRAKSQRTNPAAVHLTFAEACADKRDQLREAGRFVGKRAMLSVTVGTSRETYAFGGRSGDIDLMLWPVNFSLVYVGYDVPTHFIAYGVEAGMRYSDPEAVEKRLRGIVEDFRAELPQAPRRETLPFNRMGCCRGSGWNSRAA